MPKYSKRYVYLVRHGETLANEKGIIDGVSVNSPLNNRGREQSWKLGRWIARELRKPPYYIYTSPAMRAHQSAENIQSELLIFEQKFGCYNPSIIICPQLHEIDHGSWEGQRLDDIAKKYPTEYQRYRERIVSVKFPGGESVCDAALRAWTVFCDIVQQHPEDDILIVGHSGVNHCIIASILQTLAFETFRQNNACINIIENTPEAPYPFRISLLNSTAHLL